jgi:acetyl esterase
MDDAPAARERGLRTLLRAALALPEPLRRALRGPVRTNDRGDRLDPVLQVLCRLEALQPQDLEGRTPIDARRRLLGSTRIVEGPARAVARIERRRVADVPVCIYVPRRGSEPLPVLLYAHGGGWVCGDLRTHDRLCRRLAADAGQIVVSADYPLAPEAPYPAGLLALTDLLRAIRADAASFGGDPARVAVGGDSAGGNLSAAVCLALRDAGEPQPAFQLLLYPGLDLRCLSASYRLLGRDFLLTQDSIQWYIRHYGAASADPRASVLLEPDLTNLAPAVVVTAGFDPLRDDGEAYAARLAQAGVEVEALPFPSLLHGFLNMDGVCPAADRAAGAVVESVRRRWGRAAAVATAYGGEAAVATEPHAGHMGTATSTEAR